MTQNQIALLRAAAAMPLNMDTWLKQHGCNTVGCIAGNVCLLTSRTRTERRLADCTMAGISREAAEILGLSRENTETLFHWDGWPWPFREDLINLEPETPEYMEVVKARVEHFIVTGE